MVIELSEGDRLRYKILKHLFIGYEERLEDKSIQKYTIDKLENKILTMDTMNEKGLFRQMISELKSEGLIIGSGSPVQVGIVQTEHSGYPDKEVISLQTPEEIELSDEGFKWCRRHTNLII